MFSKAMMQKVVQELSVPMLATLARESLGSIEKDDDKAREALGNAEMFMTQLRKLMPAQAENKPPRTRGRTVAGAEGGEQNGG